MLSRIDNILKILENGEWHDLKEIEQVQLPEEDIKRVAVFLAKYSFIEIDNKGKKARITSSTLNFLKKIDQLDDKDF